MLPTGFRRGSAPFRRELVEQLVLFGLEAGDRVDQVDAMTGHGARGPFGVAMLLVGERRLGDHRPDPRIIGDVGQMTELLVGDGELLAQRHEPPPDGAESTFDEEGHPFILRLGHTAEMTTMDRWNVADGWTGTDGRWHDVDPSTRSALQAAQGAAEHPDGPPSGPPLWFVRPGERHRLWSPCSVELEDGTRIDPSMDLHPELPLGTHRLVPDDGSEVTTLFVVPGSIPGPGRTWGWSTQLYATRSRTSWGLGDLGDLARLARWSARSGASLLAHNPLGSTVPLRTQQTSPYYASSRRNLSPLYLDVAAVPGAELLGSSLQRAADAGAALSDSPLIDRDAVWQLKLGVLRQIWGLVRLDGRTRATLEADHDPDGVDHAVFCALAEHHGSGWRDWPVGHRHPRGVAVAEFVEGHRDQIEFWRWLQLETVRQLQSAATAGAGLLADLPVGFDPSGADAWVDQDLLALDCSIGAPPDDLGPLGQDWGLPPYIPWKLRAAGYRPWLDTLRHVLGHGAALRVDHVMGLFRLFWIPSGGDARHGGYVYQGGSNGGDGDIVELLDLALMEAARAGAFLVGEDLGTVEPEVRTAMTRRRVFGYRIAWFEDEPARQWPADSLAALTTHDLPTVAGLWTGDDERARIAAGQPADAEAEATMRARLAHMSGLDPSSGGAHVDADGIDTVLDAAHRGLAESGSDLAIATIEDAIGTVRRPNLPGTVDEYPNWRIPLPVSIEELDDAGAVRVAFIMGESGR